MAKKDQTVNKFESLKAEIAERMAAREKRIAKLTAERQTAEKAYNAAVSEYNAAKNALDASAMIQAKASKDAAESVFNMFSEALDKEVNDNAFTYDEILEKHREFSAINNELVAQANREICRKLASIEADIRPVKDASKMLDDMFTDINNGTAACGNLTAGQLIQNIERSINHTKEHFPGYWPDK